MCFEQGPLSISFMGKFTKTNWKTCCVVAKVKFQEN